MCRSRQHNKVGNKNCKHLICTKKERTECRKKVVMVRTCKQNRRMQVVKTTKSMNINWKIGKEKIKKMVGMKGRYGLKTRGME
jgi:hypothetical protein